MHLKSSLFAGVAIRNHFDPVKERVQNEEYDHHDNPFHRETFSQPLVGVGAIFWKEDIPLEKIEKTRGGDRRNETNNRGLLAVLHQLFEIVDQKVRQFLLAQFK